VIIAIGLCIFLMRCRHHRVAQRQREVIVIESNDDANDPQVVELFPPPRVKNPHMKRSALHQNPVDGNARSIAGPAMPNPEAREPDHVSGAIQSNEPGAQPPALSAIVEMLYQRQLQSSNPAIVGEGSECPPPSYGSEQASISHILHPPGKDINNQS
jgi:hypothetical protein